MRVTALMRVTICTINVGAGEGNQNIVMQLLGLVGVFVILNGPVGDDK